MTLVRFDDVSFSYDDATAVLAGVSLSIANGELVALLGPNGVGKTTLTKLVVALLKPGRGTVTVGGRDTAPLMPEDLADQVAYVFQHPDQQLFARTVLDEVMFAPLQRLSRADAHDVAMQALRRVGLSGEHDTHPYDLPPAQQKLVTIAAAMAQRPAVLVLDEPTQGLDRDGIARVGTLLRAVATEGVAVLAVTHDLGFVTEMFERAVVLCEGSVAFDGPPRDLILDERRVRESSLRTPPAARLSRALGLPGTPVRVEEVIAALRGWLKRP